MASAITSAASAPAMRPIIPLALTIGAIACCGGFGVYGTFLTAARNGLFDALTHSLGSHGQEPHYLGGPAPYRFSFTGLGGIDKQIPILVALFTIVIDNPSSWSVTFCLWYLMTQFCAGFSLLVLEGHRYGSKGRLVSWTGTIGVILQRISYALCVPLYLVTHLLSSPAAVPGPDHANNLAATPADLTLLPFTNIFFFWVPAALMNLSSPSIIAPATHYGWNALWQVFPMWQSMWQWLLKQPLRSRSSVNPLKGHLQSAGRSYYYILALATVSHTAGLVVASLPQAIAPAAMVTMIAEVDLTSTFVPYLPWNSPLVGNVETPAIPELAELVQLFFQWDVYSASVAILVWAVYLHSSAIVSSSVMTFKTLTWGVFGGPIAVAAILLWERDIIALEKTEAEKKKS